MYYIIDTNVLLSGLLFSGSKEEKTIEYCSEHGLLCFSDETQSEFLEVSLRSKFDKYISREIRTLFTTKILTESVTILPVIKHTLCRDPKDDKFLDVALAIKATYLITGDQDLLVLKKFGETNIVTAAEFMRIHDEK